MATWIQVAPGLTYNEVRRSDGQMVVAGDRVVVHYTLALGEVPEGEPAWLENTWEKSAPFKFTVGAGEVLKVSTRSYLE